MIIESIVVVIFSLLLGSFLNVVALRVPEGGSINYPPSHCPKCQHRLHALDLIPVLSFLFLRGKCRYCHASIHWHYPLGELATAFFLTVTFWQLGWSPEYAIGVVFTAMLVAITMTDLRTMLIPDKILLASMLFLIPLRVWHHPSGLTDAVLGALIGGGIIAALVLGSLLILKKEGMGLGDLKLMIVVGWVVGVQDTLLTLFLASFLGGLIGMILIATKRATRESYMPFGPYLALGAWIVYLWGDDILDAYWGLFLPHP